MDASREGSAENDSNGDVISAERANILPAYMSSAMRRQYLEEMIKAFPPALQNRINALKNLQIDQLKLEAKFFEEVYLLEKQYQRQYEPLFTKRRDIINGAIDPPHQEPKWKKQYDTEAEATENRLASNNSHKIQVIDKGIPDFWLTVFRNTEVLWEMVQEHDEPALKKLFDISIVYNDELSYTLLFHFDKNEYFSNSVLSKQYFLKASIDEDDPFSFEGPEIYKCKGCVINWEKKMNLTVKTIRKKQKHKERGSVRTIVKQVPTDSFFNFFDPPQVADNEECDEESQGILATDFEIGHFIRARIIPKAVLYYTGDIVDDDDLDYEEDGDVSTDEDAEEKEAATKSHTPNECANQ